MRAANTVTGAPFPQHADCVNSAPVTVFPSGARVEGPYTYDAYGNCFLGTTTTSCTTLASSMEPFRYTGQRFDADTGLYYYRARYYGPGIGRFYETDPVDTGQISIGTPTSEMILRIRPIRQGRLLKREYGDRSTIPQHSDCVNSAPVTIFSFTT